MHRLIFIRYCLYLILNNKNLPWFLIVKYTMNICDLRISKILTKRIRPKSSLILNYLVSCELWLSSRQFALSTEPDPPDIIASKPITRKSDALRRRKFWVKTPGALHARTRFCSCSTRGERWLSCHHKSSFRTWQVTKRRLSQLFQNFASRLRHLKKCPFFDPSLSSHGALGS